MLQVQNIWTTCLFFVNVWLSGMTDSRSHVTRLLTHEKCAMWFAIFGIFTTTFKYHLVTLPTVCVS